ncbi:hypothetical protein T492DRAFT_886753, partial [Pavlovales sp. CCMP2436]
MASSATRESVAAYVATHELEPKLNAMLNELVQARPENAQSWMSGYLANAGGNGAPATKASAGAAPVVAGAAKPLASVYALRIARLGGPASRHPPNALHPDSVRPPSRAQLVDICTSAQKSLYPDVTLDGHYVTECTKPEWGEYQNNTALSLYGKLKGTPGAPTNPRAVATALVEA